MFSGRALLTGRGSPATAPASQTAEMFRLFCLMLLTDHVDKEKVRSD